MKYIALLRGINVGGGHRVEMKKLKVIFEECGGFNVSTYINSGNVIFESKKSQTVICADLKACFKKEFDFEIPLLIKTAKEMEKISKAIPDSWQNNADQKTDIAYLFEEVDYKGIIDELPINKDFINTFYIKGAVGFNVSRKNYSKSKLNKIIGHKIYKFMTLRNVNTARYLVDLKLINKK